MLADDTGIRRYVPESEDTDATPSNDIKNTEPKPIEPIAPVDIDKMMPLKPHDHKDHHKQFMPSDHKDEMHHQNHNSDEFKYTKTEEEAATFDFIKCPMDPSMT